MNEFNDGVETARGWHARKYYLSDEAIALLVEHCKGTPLTMSAYLDQLIKQELGEPRVGWTPEEVQAHEAEFRRVLDEGQRQIAELTAAYDKPRTITTQDGTTLPVPPMKHTDTRSEKQPTKKDFKVDI